MSNMTWAEFKNYIDSVLDELEIDPDTPINYIDVTNPNPNHEMTIPAVIKDDGEISIYT